MTKAYLNSIANPDDLALASIISHCIGRNSRGVPIDRFSHRNLATNVFNLGIGIGMKVRSTLFL